MILRRKVLLGIGAGIVGSAATAIAQPRNQQWRIGVLSGRQRPVSIESSPIGGLLQGLQELGYVEGKNIAIEWRFAEGRYDLIPELANELVRSKVNVIVVTTPAAIRPLQALKLDTPIVLGTSIDPVGNGFISSLSRPGGRTTGMASLADEASAKHLQMMASVVPKLSRVGLLLNSGNPNSKSVLNAIQPSAKRTGVSILPAEIKSAQDMVTAFASLTKDRAGAVIIALDALFNSNLRELGELAVKHRLPSIYGLREYAELGGLMSYGENLRDLYRRSATYVDKILKGANPAEMPVELPTTFELIINRRTAKVLDIAIPQSLLISSDKVIE